MYLLFVDFLPVFIAHTGNFINIFRLQGLLRYFKNS